MERKTIKLNMRDAVLKTEAEINYGRKGFFIDTEFGKLGIEINPFRELDPLHPVSLFSWEQSPDTQWAISHRNNDADYYVGINIFGIKNSDKMAMIEAISRAMLFDSGFVDPEDNIIQAMIVCYLTNYEEANITINSMVSDYRECHLNGLIKMASMSAPIETVIREMFQLKMNSGRDIIDMGSELLAVQRNAGRVPENFFNDKYCEEVFGILLYARMKQERSLESSLKNIINFNTPASKLNKAIAINE